MNKYFRKWAAVVVLASLFIFVGALAKLTGSPDMVLIFSELDFFGFGEEKIRIAFGIFEIILALSLFARPLRRPAAFIASILLCGITQGIHSCLSLG